MPVEGYFQERQKQESPGPQKMRLLGLLGLGPGCEQGPSTALSRPDDTGPADPCNGWGSGEGALGTRLGLAGFVLSGEGRTLGPAFSPSGTSSPA